MSNLTPDTSLALINAAQAQTDNATRSLKNATKIDQQSQIDAVARDFEAMFITEMMKPMFEGLETDGQFGGGKTEEVFRGLMLEEYGKMIAETGQLGIADAVKAEMIRMQEDVDGTTNAN